MYNFFIFYLKPIDYAKKHQKSLMYGLFFLTQTQQKNDIFTIFTVVKPLNRLVYKLLLYFVSIIRSYLLGYTRSHPNSEVKQEWAYLVLWWGTTRES